MTFHGFFSANDDLKISASKLAQVSACLLIVPILKVLVCSFLFKAERLEGRLVIPSITDSMWPGLTLVG